MDLSPERLLAVFQRSPGRPISLGDAAEAAGAPRAHQQLVLSGLLKLVEAGQLVRLRGKYFMLPATVAATAKQTPVRRGQLHVSTRGKGFLTDETGKAEEDLIIFAPNLDTALDGDRVEAAVLSGARGRSEGRVTQILERAHEFIVGQYRRMGASTGMVNARNVRIGRMIEVRNFVAGSAGAPTGESARTPKHEKKVGEGSPGSAGALTGESVPISKDKAGATRGIDAPEPKDAGEGTGAPSPTGASPSPERERPVGQSGYCPPRSQDSTTPPSSSRPPDGAWVRVQVVRWSHAMEEPLLADIVEVLGMPGDRGISVLALLRDMGVQLEFPEAVELEARRGHAPSGAHVPPGRLDLRDVPIVTIDPATAKDFDDALSLEVLGEGRWRLGVHIADVSQYVEATTELDAEALRRGTSIYPVDRVVPMLPEHLSNGVCSLRPDEDRFALSCIMDLNAAGRVTSYQIAESVIRSRHRFSYEEVQEFLEAPKEERAAFAFADVGDLLLGLRDVARALNRMRMQRGALDLDLPETLIVCDEGGEPTDVRRHERFESHRLVEECMLIANETVAEHMKREKIPGLYRIHDIPDPNAVARIAPALALFGVQVPAKMKPTPSAYQPLIDRLHRVPGGHIAQRLILRTLMRAEYSPENRGHFGLASTCYCHFTSPIRRYPDLLTHRVIKAWLHGGEADSPAAREAVRATLDVVANQSNLTADRAEGIERDAVNIKSMEFMKDQEGAAFEGWISGIARRGLFVELVDIPVDGFVDARTIEGDTFSPDDHMIRLVGRTTRRSYALGQRVRVIVTKVRVMEGEMELMLVEKRSPDRTGKKKKRQRKGKR
jgi:ribonuclease R